MLDRTDACAVGRECRRGCKTEYTEKLSIVRQERWEREGVSVCEYLLATHLGRHSLAELYDEKVFFAGKCHQPGGPKSALVAVVGENHAGSATGPVGGNDKTREAVSVFVVATAM